MKKVLFLFIIAIFGSAAFAQDDFSSSRLDNLSNRLKRDTVDLAERSSEDLRRSSSLSRTAIEEAFLAAQIDASVGIFQDMVRDKRRAAELRDAAALLSDLARRAPAFGNNSSLWRNVQTSINDINRELGSGGGGGGFDDRPVIGRVYWRGMVDDKVQLVIRGNNVESRTISGQSYPDGTFSFTAVLPNREVNVGVTKTRGRGNVRVVQQPTAANNYTAVIEIVDSGGGAREYQLDIFWR